jgi:hypothetical protein
MSDEIIETYYQKNREMRREYQKRYYKTNAQLIKRKRELESVLDPEKQDARKRYNQEYYLVNRASIQEQRARRAAAKALTQI